MPVKTKYIVLLAGFAVLFMFVGEQNVFSLVKRAAAINRNEKQIAVKKQQIEQCKREIRLLENTDSLESFAREHYYMHAEGEDVYLVAD